MMNSLSKAKQHNIKLFFVIFVYSSFCLCLFVFSSTPSVGIELPWKLKIQIHIFKVWNSSFFLTKFVVSGPAVFHLQCVDIHQDFQPSSSLEGWGSLLTPGVQTEEEQSLCISEKPENGHLDN